MARNIIIVVLALVGLVHAGGHAYHREENVRAVSGEIRLARRWDRAFAEDFEQGLGAWQVQNYEEKLAVGAGEGRGEEGSCVSVTNHGAEGDTAFEVASPSVPVDGGAAFRFAFWWHANRPLERLSGHKGRYMTQLQWRDAAQETIGALPFSFGKACKQWQAKRLEGTAPDGATSVVIRFGCDHPNIADKEHLAIDDVVLDVRPKRQEFERRGHVVSRPFRAAGDVRSISWEAETPPGTAVRLQVAGAPDDGGGPGTWSELLGPDATTGSYFTGPGDLPPAHRGLVWLRYTALLTAEAPTRTPVLKSVTIADVTDGPWDGRDTTPPVVSERSPTRTGDLRAPVRFRLTDEIGIDWRTLHVELDGADITQQLYREEEQLTFRPLEPWFPPPAEAPLGRWRITNYRNALAIGRTVRRTPGSPPGLHITREVGKVDTAFCVRSPAIPVAPGATYRFSYWSRHSVDLNGAMDRKGKFSGGLSWVDEQDAPVGERVPVDFGTANPEWHCDSSELTAPAGAVSAQIAFGFDSPNLFDGAFVDIAEAVLEGPRPQRVADSPNLHRITVEAADFAGNSLSRTWHLLIRPPRTKDVVTVRDDGMVLVDGQLFFPIGLYAVWKKAFNEDSFDKAFSGLKAAGFNLAHTYSSRRGPEFAEFYAAAARHGIKLYVASDAGANCTSVDAVLWDVAREEGQPALLAWYLADDTASHVGHEELRAVTEAIHDIDPAHPTVQADGVGGPETSRYAAYTGATDGFLPELYPIRDDSNKGVPRIIQGMKTVQADLARAGTRQKTVWAIVQYFQGWGWPRYPTRDELWAMSYLSIIHGANGITWYTYGGWGDNHGVTDTPEKWETICGLAGELSQLQHVLTERTGPQPPAPVILDGPKEDALGYPSVSALLKEGSGERHLLAASSAGAEVTVQFRVGGVGKVELPFEPRELTGGEHGFTDTFGPYEVHVYTWSR